MNQKEYYELSLKIKTNMKEHQEYRERGILNNQTIFRCEDCLELEKEECFGRDGNCKKRTEYIDEALERCNLHCATGVILAKEIDRLREIEWMYNGLG